MTEQKAVKGRPQHGTQLHMFNAHHHHMHKVTVPAVMPLVFVCVPLPAAPRLMLHPWWWAARPSAPTWLCRRMATPLSLQLVPTATPWPAAAGVCLQPTSPPWVVVS
jgi:hypothetical protein